MTMTSIENSTAENLAPAAQRLYLALRYAVLKMSLSWSCNAS